jgi:uncharacterized protein (DUF58 family)
MAKLERLAVLARRPHAGSMQGDRRSPRRGQSVEFADYRSYSRGDDFRQIDWNAYARLERFFVKLFVAEEDLRVHLVIDASRSMAWGSPPKIEAARRIAAAVGYIGLLRLDRVATAWVDERLRGVPQPLRGRAMAGRLVHELDRGEASGGTNLAAGLRAYAAASRPGPLVLLTDLYDPSWMDGVRSLLGARFDVSLLHVLSPEELQPDLEGDLRLVDDETGVTVEITADDETLRRYDETLTAWRAEARDWCRSRGVTYISVSSAVPIDELITSVLRRRRVIG